MRIKGKKEFMASETGFPSPARGYEEQSIDLNTLLITNPPATFLMRVSGEQLVYKGVYEGDLLVVDRSRSAVAGNLAVIRFEGEFLCREILREGGRLSIQVSQRAVVPLTEETPLFGTVTAVVRKL